MQFISNIVLNLILLYPLLLLREYSRTNILDISSKVLTYIAIYFFIINKIFIDMGDQFEYLIYFYIVFLVPTIIFSILYIAKQNGYVIVLFSESKIIGIKDSKAVALLLGYASMFIILSIVNIQTDSHVLDVNEENFNIIRNAENPLEELVYLTENPQTMIANLEKLKSINPNDFEVLFSGNNKKELRVIVEVDDMTYSYEITYRRRNIKWILDGVFRVKIQY